MTISSEIRQQLASQSIELPVFHPVALNLMMLNSDPFSDFEDIVKAINQDPSLASQVLKMANSSAYMGLVKAETIKESVVRLGARQITILAMAASQAAIHTSEITTINSVMKELWQHSLACALGSSWVARNTGHDIFVEHAYLAGLLHDIGKLYLLKAVEKIVKEGNSELVVTRNMLMEIFSEMHVEQGCRVLDQWNIPPIYKSVLESHHSEQFNRVEILITIVRLVNLVSRNIRLSLNSEPVPIERLLPKLELLNMDDSMIPKLESVMTGSLSSTH